MRGTILRMSTLRILTQNDATAFDNSDKCNLLNDYFCSIATTYHYQTLTTGTLLFLVFINDIVDEIIGLCSCLQMPHSCEKNRKNSLCTMINTDIEIF